MIEKDYLANKCSKIFNIKYKICTGLLYNLSAGLIVAPYILYVGKQKRDNILISIGTLLLFVEFYMFTLSFHNKNEMISDYLSKKLSLDYDKVFKFIYCFIPAYIIAPTIFHKGILYKKFFLTLIAIIIFVVDNYHLRVEL